MVEKGRHDDTVGGVDIVWGQEGRQEGVTHSARNCSFSDPSPLRTYWFPTPGLSLLLYSAEMISR